MFCKYCGTKLPKGAKFCASCGKPIDEDTEKKATKKKDKILKEDDLIEKVENGLDNAEKQMGEAIEEVVETFNSSSSATPRERLQDDRNLVAYILLSIITFGIYSWYFIYKMAHDVNIACEEDGDSTIGLVGFILLSFITCGIYGLIWEYQLGNRLQSNAKRYGLEFVENGTTVLMWSIFGSLLCFIGAFVATNILIKNSNAICAEYNREHGYVN